MTSKEYELAERQIAIAKEQADQLRDLVEAVRNLAGLLETAIENGWG
jgi:hypothetical protein